MSGSLGLAGRVRLQGARLTLTPFTPDRISARYLAWLGDPVVNAHSQRAGRPVPSVEEAARYLIGLSPFEAVFAMDCAQLGHIGNVKFGPIDETNARSDISILVGEHSAWGKGYGAEAVYLVTRHLFETRGLNRVDAGSANPAFLALVSKLGWRVEGVRREAVRVGGTLRDWTLVALLAREFVRRPEFEAAGRETV